MTAAEPRRADVQPTQARYPWRATLRTALAVAMAVGVVLPVAWGYLAEALTPYVAAEVLGWVGGVVALLVAVSGAITRIMAIPQVNAWLTRIGVGAAPKHADEPPVEVTDAPTA